MKAYFSASVRGKAVYGKQYKQIVETLEKLDFSVFSDHILKTESDGIDKQSLDQVKTVYKALIVILQSIERVSSLRLFL